MTMTFQHVPAAKAKSAVRFVVFLGWIWGGLEVRALQFQGSRVLSHFHVWGLEVRDLGLRVPDLGP